MIRETITARQNPTVIRTASLAEKKYRDQYGLFVADGIKLTLEAAAAGLPVVCVFIAQSRTEDYLQRVEEAFSGPQYDRTRLCILSDTCFEKISTERSPQGVCCVIKYLDKITNIIKINKVDEFASSDAGGVFLSSVRDPSNLGAIMRSADAFGFTHLFLSPDCADPYNPRTVRAAMGALFRLHVLTVPSEEETIAALRKTRRVFAAELTPQAVSIVDRTPLRRDVVIIGNEGHGIRPAVSELCDGSLYLPISPNTESLNAAVAASILLWEQSKNK